LDGLREFFILEGTFLVEALYSNNQTPQAMNTAKTESSQTSTTNSKTIQVAYGIMGFAAVLFLLYMGFQFGVWLK